MVVLSHADKADDELIVVDVILLWHIAIIRPVTYTLVLPCTQTHTHTHTDTSTHTCTDPTTCRPNGT